MQVGQMSLWGGIRHDLEIIVQNTRTFTIRAERVSMTFHLLSDGKQIVILRQVVFCGSSFAGRPPQIALIGPSRAPRGGWCTCIFKSDGAVLGNVGKSPIGTGLRGTCESSTVAKC